jgi:hypothetical protein
LTLDAAEFGEPEGRRRVAGLVLALEVQRRLRQARKAPVEHVGTQRLQPPDGAIRHGPDDPIGGRIPGRRVEVELHGGGGLTLIYR